MIVIAAVSDAKLLTEVALTSKAYWEYSIDFIENWRDDLTVRTTMIKEMVIYKFLQNDVIAGFYALNPPKGNSIELEMLFVLPEFIGKGIGKQLLKHSIEKAQNLTCKSMTLLADPNAADFYKSQGFYIIDKKESSIPNRFLPIMQKDLAQ